MGKFRTLETELERLRERIEAENEAKAEIQKAMSRALAEAQIWKSKYTTEACARIEDLENARAKLLVSKQTAVKSWKKNYFSATEIKLQMQGRLFKNENVEIQFWRKLSTFVFCEFLTPK